MKKDEFFGITGEIVPFGDEVKIKSTDETSSNCKKEKGYCRLCKSCKSDTPESMKYFIDEDVRDEDELYYCFLCDFIGARPAYQIMDILFNAGLVKEFPQKTSLL